jgi:hypothetical protein
MPKTHICERCGKNFKQKSHLDAHMKRKRPCKKDDTLSKLIEEKVEEKVNKLVNNRTMEILAKGGERNEVVEVDVKRKGLSPLVKWSGGKKDEIKQILDHIPKKFDTYLEPFIGGGALYFYLNPLKAAISDVHMELIDLYTSIKNGHASSIHKFMSEHPNTEDEYYKVRSMNINDTLKTTLCF